MKYKNKLCKLILVLSCTIWVSDVFAFGMGLAGMQGSETWEEDIFHNGDRDISSFGMVLDTNIAKDSLFNYRLTLALEENEPSNNRGLTLEGFALTHDFGFAVYRNPYVKLWLGPELKFGFYDTTFNDNSGREAREDGAFGMSFGPVFGVNVHLPKVVSFTATIAYQFIGFYAGEYDLYQNGFYSTTVDVEPEHTGSLNISLGILFRFGADNF